MVTTERTIILINPVVASNAIMVIRNLPTDGTMELAIRPRRKARSENQNRLMWGARLKEISEQAWVAGKQFSSETWHEYLKSQYLPEGDEPNIEELVKDADKYQKWAWMPDGSRRLAGSTTQLTTKGMTQYMTQVESYCAGELGVQFSADRMGT